MPGLTSDLIEANKKGTNERGKEREEGGRDRHRDRK